MSLLNKTETKYIKQKLKQQIFDSQTIIKRSEESLNNERLPNYDLSVHQKQLKKQNAEITMCEQILSKLEQSEG